MTDNLDNPDEQQRWLDMQIDIANIFEKYNMDPATASAVLIDLWAIIIAKNSPTAEKRQEALHTATEAMAGLCEHYASKT